MKTRKKSIIDNMIFNALYKGIYILFPVITIPYLSKTILAEGIGKVNFSISIVNYFLIFASLGIPQYGIREIARVKNNKEKLSKTFMEIYSINFIATLVSFSLYMLMVSYLPYFKSRMNLSIIMGGMLALNIFKVDWFYQGVEEYRYIAIRSIIVKAISLLLILIFVKSEQDFNKYAVIYVIASTSNDILNMIRLPKFVKYTFKKLNFSNHMKPIIIMVATQLAISIYINLDTTMLGILSGDVAVGIYTNASKLNKLIVTVITSISVVLLPRFSSYLQEKNFDEINRLVNEMIKVLIFLSLPIAIGIFIEAEDIVAVFLGNGFKDAIATMKVMTPLIVILSIGNLFGTQILLTFRKENKLLKSVLVGAIINFCLNFKLIPIYQENGAAIASVVAELFVLILQIKYAQKYIKIKQNLKSYKNVFIGIIYIYIYISIVKKLLPMGIIRLIVSVIVGGIGYFIINSISSNSIGRDIYNIIKKI